MLIARLEPWHWWIGIILTVVTIVTLLGFVGLYLKQVVRPQYPTKRQRQNS